MAVEAGRVEGVRVEGVRVEGGRVEEVRVEGGPPPLCIAGRGARHQVVLLVGSPPLFFWIYEHPSSEMALLFSLAFGLVSVVGLLVFRALVHRWLHRDESANEMVGFAMSSFSVLYGLLLGLLAVAAYQGFSVTSDLVTKESGELAALYRASGALPAPVGPALEDDLRGYAREVIDVSWPLQQRGVVPTRESALIDDFFVNLHSFEPATLREQTVQAEALGLANQLVQTRRARLVSVTGGIPDLLWWVVLTGGVVNMMLLWMLDMARHTHVVLTALIGGFLGLVIFLIAAMDFPFRGEVSVSPEPFEYAFRSLMTEKAAPAR